MLSCTINFNIDNNKKKHYICILESIRKDCVTLEIGVMAAEIWALSQHYILK